MQQFRVQLHSVQDVEIFVGIVTAQPFPVTVSGGFHETSGRSFMEMFCLDFNQPLRVVAQCSEEELADLCADAEKFLVE